jgi:hypothetical protein
MRAIWEISGKRLNSKKCGTDRGRTTEGEKMDRGGRRFPLGKIQDFFLTKFVFFV